MKSDGSACICGDDKVTINPVDKYPIPCIEDLFSSLSGGAKFPNSTFHTLISRSRQCGVIINTDKGLFRYNRLPFGVVPAQSIFQRVMETILQGTLGVCVYINDILVSGHIEKEHLNHLTEILRQLKEAKMQLKKKNVSIFCHLSSTWVILSAKKASVHKKQKSRYSGRHLYQRMLQNSVRFLVCSIIMGSS